MKAYVNHGRWVVECPGEDCNGAELAPPTCNWVRCSSCSIEFTVDHPSAWPEIDAVLAQRRVINRNWYPGESVMDLINENREHGMVV